MNSFADEVKFRLKVAEDDTMQGTENKLDFYWIENFCAASTYLAKIKTDANHWMDHIYEKGRGKREYWLQK